MPPAGGHLRGGQGDADTGAARVADEVQERPPAAAEIEHPAARPDAYLLGHILMLAPLGLLEAQGEITVVLGAAEVRELSQTEPEDAIDQRIGELEIRAVSHPDPIVILLEPTIDPVQHRSPRIPKRRRRRQDAGPATDAEPAPSACRWSRAASPRLYGSRLCGAASRQFRERRHRRRIPVSACALCESWLAPQVL